MAWHDVLRGMQRAQNLTYPDASLSKHDALFFSCFICEDGEFYPHSPVLCGRVDGRSSPSGYLPRLYWTVTFGITVGSRVTFVREADHLNALQNNYLLKVTATYDQVITNSQAKTIWRQY